MTTPRKKKRTWPGQGTKAATVTGRLPLAVKGRVIYYTDGSAAGRPTLTDAWRRRTWATGWSYVSTDGRFGFGSYPQAGEAAGDDRAVVAELRAIWQAINIDRSAPGGTQGILVRSDSLYAAAMIERWKNGDQEMPSGYGGSITGTPTLAKLRDYVAQNPALVTVEHVAGHAGDPMNEAAHSAARLGMQMLKTRLPRDEAERQAQLIIEYRMRDAGARRIALIPQNARPLLAEAA